LLILYFYLFFMLSIGKKDIPSYGVEDQFSKSDYVKTMPDATRHGLCEKRAPGVFTPRKNPTNPSGDPAIVRQWASSIDLNNKAMACGIKR
jgi:hypothetical protein